MNNTLSYTPASSAAGKHWYNLLRDLQQAPELRDNHTWVNDGMGWIWFLIETRWWAAVVFISIISLSMCVCVCTCCFFAWYDVYPHVVLTLFLSCSLVIMCVFPIYPSSSSAAAVVAGSDVFIRDAEPGGASPIPVEEYQNGGFLKRGIPFKFKPCLFQY